MQLLYLPDVGKDRHDLLLRDDGLALGDSLFERGLGDTNDNVQARGVGVFGLHYLVHHRQALTVLLLLLLGGWLGLRQTHGGVSSRRRTSACGMLCESDLTCPSGPH